MINGHSPNFDTRQRLFWLGIRKALIELIRAIEIYYGLDSAIITAEQRKQLRREKAAVDIGENA